MVSNKVAAKETLQDLHPILESLVDIRARERRVDKETDIRVHISLLYVEGSQQQVDVMNPNHVTLLLDLDQVLWEYLIHLTICVPHFSILLIYFIFVISFEIVEKWS